MAEQRHGKFVAHGKSDEYCKCLYLCHGRKAAVCNMRSSRSQTNIATRYMLLRRCFRNSFRIAISRMPSGRPLSTWYILCCAGVNCCYRLALSRSGLQVGGPVAHADVARHPPVDGVNHVDRDLGFDDRSVRQQSSHARADGDAPVKSHVAQQQWSRQR
jgi:hypothetical protein